MFGTERTKIKPLERHKLKLAYSIIEATIFLVRELHGVGLLIQLNHTRSYIH